MIANKHIEKIVLSIVAAGLALVFLAMCFVGPLSASAGSNDGVDEEYTSKLFDTSKIISINIKMDKSKWKKLLSTAINETYYPCDVVINGTTFKNVGIRAKGNTSLSAVYKDKTTQRYSFKLEFGHYVKGQTCFGLDKLVLNNNYADATSMKEAITYDMFAYLGADASLYNYASISVNGTYWGCYLALEAVEKSFALRNYGVDYGELYKPDSMNGNGAGGMKSIDSTQLKKMAGADNNKSSSSKNSSSSSSDNSKKSTNDSSTSTKASQHGPGGGNGPGGGTNSGNGADLNYVDDDLDSYSTIWESEVTKTTKSDHRRVVKALKNISKNKNLSTYMDVDNLLRYLAVQTFVVNLDGLAGNMAHNYYLYENGGQLNLIPWDYNLAFGGFQSGNASSVINFPINTPFSTGLKDREFFAALLNNDEYLAKYHKYLKKLAEGYVNGGVFKNTVSRIRSQIDSLVASDPTAFYTESEYKTAVSTLENVVKLRAKSVSGQLDGTIPSTTSGQSSDSSNLIDSSKIDLTVMGTMNMGGGQQKDQQNTTKTNTTQSQSTQKSNTTQSQTTANSDAKNSQSTDDSKKKSS